MRDLVPQSLIDEYVQTLFDKLSPSVQNTMIEQGRQIGVEVEDVKDGFNKAQRKLHRHSDPWNKPVRGQND